MVTDVGRLRKNNEDNCYLNGEYKRTPELTEWNKQDTVYESGIFAVCDGMGGEEFGERASLFAVEILKEYHKKDFEKYASEYVKRVNEKICDFIDENNGVRTGTTLALVYINDDKAICYNIGDSRIYLYRNKKLIKLSEDHTRVSQLVKMKIITEQQAETHPDKHVLTQHLGIFPEEMVIQPYISKVEGIKNDDIFVICSDGLTDMLNDTDIRKYLSKKASAQENAKTLLNAALERGGRDNVTVGVIKYIGIKKRLF